jgi:hypothetical protein
MLYLKGLTGFAAAAAACTAMTWSGIALAATPASDSSQAASMLTLDQPIAAQAQYLDDSTPPAAWTVQGALANTPVGKFMTDQKLTLNFYAEASYTYNLRNVIGLTNYQRVFDVNDQHLDLNQADMKFARAATQGGTNWDWGFMAEVLYGTDGRFIHSSGLNFYGGQNPQVSPAQQWDIEQAYFTLNAPVGNGLLFTVGKFATLLSYETINPTSNPLFSHTYSYGLAVPFTNTGVLANYQLNNQWAVTAGVTRGWDQALKQDTGDALNATGQIAYTSYNVKGLKGFFNFITGPASADIVPDQVNRYWRSVGEVILSYAYGDNWTFATDAVYGYEPKAGIGGKNASWFGDTLYATYKFNSYVSATARGEYFSDHDGARGLGGEVYEATAGLEITPFPTNEYLQSLLFRPEFREDFSGEKLFDAGTQYNQATVAADLIYQF